jgi:hypothetical protein
MTITSNTISRTPDNLRALKLPRRETVRIAPLRGSVLGARLGWQAASVEPIQSNWEWLFRVMAL